LSEKLTQTPGKVVGRAAVVKIGESLDWDIPLHFNRFSSGSSEVLLDLKIDLRALTALPMDTMEIALLFLGILIWLIASMYPDSCLCVSWVGTLGYLLQIAQSHLKIN